VVLYNRRFGYTGSPSRRADTRSSSADHRRKRRSTAGGRRGGSADHCDGGRCRLDRGRALEFEGRVEVSGSSHTLEEIRKPCPGGRRGGEPERGSDRPGWTSKAKRPSVPRSCSSLTAPSRRTACEPSMRGSRWALEELAAPAPEGSRGDRLVSGTYSGRLTARGSCSCTIRVPPRAYEASAAGRGGAHHAGL